MVLLAIQQSIKLSLPPASQGREPESSSAPTLTLHLAEPPGARMPVSFEEAPAAAAAEAGAAAVAACAAAAAGAGAAVALLQPAAAAARQHDSRQRIRCYTALEPHDHKLTVLDSSWI